MAFKYGCPSSPYSIIKEFCIMPSCTIMILASVAMPFSLTYTDAKNGCERLFIPLVSHLNRFVKQFQPHHWMI